MKPKSLSKESRQTKESTPTKESRPTHTSMPGTSIEMDSCKEMSVDASKNVPTPSMHVPTPSIHVPTSSMHVPTSSMHVPTSSMNVPTPFNFDKQIKRKCYPQNLADVVSVAVTALRKAARSYERYLTLSQYAQSIRVGVRHLDLHEKRKLERLFKVKKVKINKKMTHSVEVVSKMTPSYGRQRSTKLFSCFAGASTESFTAKPAVYDANSAYGNQLNSNRNSISARMDAKNVSSSPRRESGSEQPLPWRQEPLEVQRARDQHTSPHQAMHEKIGQRSRQQIDEEMQQQTDRERPCETCQEISSGRQVIVGPSLLVHEEWNGSCDTSPTDKSNSIETPNYNPAFSMNPSLKRVSSVLQVQSRGMSSRVGTFLPWKPLHQDRHKFALRAPQKLARTLHMSNASEVILNFPSFHIAYAALKCLSKTEALQNCSITFCDKNYRFSLARPHFILD